MKNKDRRLPELVFIGPPKFRSKYVLRAFAILELNAEGVPTVIRMLSMEEEIDVRELPFGFMTGYVPEVMTKPNPTRLEGGSGTELK